MSERRKGSDRAQNEKQGPRKRAVAYYRHSAQDRAKNSISLQQKQVPQFAREQGVEIIKEFADCGKTGVSDDERDSLDELTENWGKTTDDFQYVLCLDASRWGRCQETTAQYNAECKRHGREVTYAIGMPDETGSLSTG